MNLFIIFIDICFAAMSYIVGYFALAPFIIFVISVVLL